MQQSRRTNARRIPGKTAFAPQVINYGALMASRSVPNGVHKIAGDCESFSKDQSIISKGRFHYYNKLRAIIQLGGSAGSAGSSVIKMEVKQPDVPIRSSEVDPFYVLLTMRLDKSV